MRPYLLALALPLALAACGQSGDGMTTADTEGDVATSATPAAPASPAMPAPTQAAPDQATTIPAALQGRWGMVPADCTSTRGDAKGLLVVSDKTLRFYESVGTLARETERSETSLRGQFSFSGEGMTWTRDVTLAVAGDRLTRTEAGGDEPGSAGPFTYTKCAA